jgi:hypothetical protein
MDPDEGGGEQLGWQLAGQLGARIVPTVEKIQFQMVSFIKVTLSNTRIECNTQIKLHAFAEYAE